ncbi:MAG: hypothetical protein ACI8XV_001931, partial [Arenicella sp.]
TSTNIPNKSNMAILVYGITASSKKNVYSCG